MENKNSNPPTTSSHSPEGGRAPITIEDLARMIEKGFEETAKKVEVNQRFNKIEDRLERIEKLLIADHRRRIEKLEEEVKELKKLLAVK